MSSVLKKCVVLLSVVAVCAVMAVPTVAGATKTVPSFSLPSVPDKKPVDIMDYRGKVVLVTFWATWCGPCVQEIPSLISLNEEFGPQGFSVIGISMDQGGARVVKKMMDKTGINYTVAMGNSKVSRDFGGIFGIPTSFLIDRSGKILKRYTGYVSHDVLARDISKAIK